MAVDLPVVYSIESVGEVAFYKGRRYKRLSIKLRSKDDIRVLIPPGCSMQSAIDFVEEKSDWIIRTRRKMAEKQPVATLFDESTTFSSRSFVLKIEKAERSDVRLYLYNGVLKVIYPEHIPVSHPPIQEAIRYGIEEALRREAKSYLPQRLQELARQFGFSYRAVFIKNLKSRWGSCSTVNNINLNLHLMRLPDRLIDYVLIHELCHTVEKNHGPNFWALLDRCCRGEARKLDKEMKGYRTQLY